MELYAELPRKLVSQMDADAFARLIPSGVTLTRKQNSRYCYFDCETKEDANDLGEALDDLGIPWQKG